MLIDYTLSKAHEDNYQIDSNRNCLHTDGQNSQVAICFWNSFILLFFILVGFFLAKLESFLLFIAG